MDTIFCERYTRRNNEVQNEASEKQTIYIHICVLAIFEVSCNYILRGAIESHSKQ